MPRLPVRRLVPAALGLAALCLLPGAANIWGHGAGWGDVDGDGWIDLYVATFHMPGSKPNRFFRNRKARFESDPRSPSPSRRAALASCSPTSTSTSATCPTRRTSTPAAPCSATTARALSPTSRRTAARVRRPVDVEVILPHGKGRRTLPATAANQVLKVRP